MKKRKGIKKKQSNVEYEKSGVQGNAGKEISGLIHLSIYHQESSSYQCSLTIIANINKNSSGCEY